MQGSQVHQEAGHMGIQKPPPTPKTFTFYVQASGAVGVHGSGCLRADVDNTEPIWQHSARSASRRLRIRGAHYELLLLICYH